MNSLLLFSFSFFFFFFFFFGPTTNKFQKQFPTHETVDDFVIFFKYYDPEKETLRWETNAEQKKRSKGFLIFFFFCS